MSGCFQYRATLSRACDISWSRREKLIEFVWLAVVEAKKVIKKGRNAMLVYGRNHGSAGGILLRHGKDIRPKYMCMLQFCFILKHIPISLTIVHMLNE